MASRQLFAEDQNASNSCMCNNICNQTNSKRCSCPCLVRGAYCTASCSCGTTKYTCINRPGKGGQLDFEFEMLSEEEGDSDADTDWMMVSFEDEEDLRVSVENLNESLQEAVEKQYPKEHEDQGPCVYPAMIDQSVDPLFEIRDASSSELLEIISLMVDHSPETKQFLTRSSRDRSPQAASTVQSPSQSYNIASPKQAPRSKIKQPRASAGAPPSPPAPNPSPSPSPDVPSWCKCGRCVQMPTPLEQRCCRRSPGVCITHSAKEDLKAAVLDQRMLLVCIVDRNEVFILNDDPDAHECLRHMAYRRFILWKYGHLGATNRRVIPSCVVKSIRRLYPSPDSIYTGYKPTRLN